MWTLYLVIVLNGAPLLVQADEYSNGRECAERITLVNDLRTLGPVPVLDDHPPVPLVGAFCSTVI